MAQASWTYPDVKGIHHSVGLYHGDRSGHFLLYCNKRIVAVDFKVFESKTYSFLIEDELCEIFLKKQTDGSFEYDFKINEEIDTPRNIQRKERRAKDKKSTYIFAVFFVAAILTFSIGMYRYEGQKRKQQFFGTAHYVGRAYEAKNLRWSGKPATTTLVFEKKDASTVEVQYELKSPVATTESSFEMAVKQGQVWLPNGFPLESGDSFYATYNADDIEGHHAIEYEKPAGNTLLRYFDLVVQVEQAVHKDESPERIVCRIKTILEERGLTGLALLLHRNTPASDNPSFNMNKSQEMLRSVFLQKKIDAACASFK